MTSPVFGRDVRLPRLQVERPKRRDTELGTKWAGFAKRLLRENPFCAECRLHGRDVLASVVDHIVPRRLGGSLWTRANLQSLCHPCHNSTKAVLERLAAQQGDVQILITWAKYPHLRPGQMAFVAVEIEG